MISFLVLAAVIIAIASKAGCSYATLIKCTTYVKQRGTKMERGAMRDGAILRRIAMILHHPSPRDLLARVFSYTLVTLILLNSAAVALETVPALASRYGPYFQWLENISTALFIIEYVARIVTATSIKKYNAGIAGRIRYLLQPVLIIDALAIISTFASFDLRYLRVLRIGRLLHVLRLDEYDRALRAIGHAVVRRKALLVISLVLMLLTIYLAATAIYYIERDVQPETFGSIPSALWWAIITLTTIGYGDAAPITIIGKVLTCFIAIGGIGIFALPSAILTAAVVEAAQDIDKEKAGTLDV